MLHALRDRESCGLRSQQARVRECLSSSVATLHRLKLEHLLDGHDGCVNTCSFSGSGDLLLTGSDDLKIILWNWQRGQQRFAFEPGHGNNIFQARAIPNTGDKTIVSCAADGQVRVSYLSDGGAVTKRKLAQHHGRAHKLAIVPDYPHCFFSCGEDGDVRFFDLRDEPGRGGGCRMAVKAGIETGQGRGIPLDLNAIHINPCRPWMFAVGGDDQYVRVYDFRSMRAAMATIEVRPDAEGADAEGDVSMASVAPKATFKALRKPVAHLAPDNLVDPYYNTRHVTCVMYSRTGELLVTYHQEDLYLLAPWGQEEAPAQGSLRDDDEGQPSSSRRRVAARRRQQRREEEEEEEEGQAGAGGEGDEGGGDAGYWGGGAWRREPHRGAKRRGGGDGGGRAGAGRGGGGRRGRRRDGSDDGGDGPSTSGGVDGVDGGAGRWGKVLMRFSGHRNVQTVKGCNFLGERDEYVVSGSDCGHIFIWSKEDGSLQQLMKGDPHVVNCLEPHPWQPLVMATSGIASDIKIWAPTAEESRPPDPAMVSEVTFRNTASLLIRDRARQTLTLSPGAVLQLQLQQLLSRRTAMARRRREEEADGAEAGGSDGGREAATRQRRRGSRQVGSDDDEEEDEDEDEEEEEEEEEGGLNANDAVSLLRRLLFAQRAAGADEDEEGGSEGEGSSSSEDSDAGPRRRGRAAGREAEGASGSSSSGSSDSGSEEEEEEEEVPSWAVGGVSPPRRPRRRPGGGVVGGAEGTEEESSSSSDAGSEGQV